MFLPDSVLRLRSLLLPIALTVGGPGIGWATGGSPAAAVKHDPRLVDRPLPGQNWKDCDLRQASSASANSRNLKCAENLPARGTTAVRLAQDSTPSDSSLWRSPDVEPKAGAKSLEDAFSTSGALNSNNPWRLGVETEKILQSPESWRRSDCPTDEECEDYTGLPRSRPARTSVKNFKKPYIGLSITSPLQ